MLWIDHVIFGARDVDAAARRLADAHGLDSYEGGVHPQFGTCNRIVPLGGCYIEIMGISDMTTAESNPLGLYVLSQIERGDRWIAWCLRTDDIASTAARIGSGVVPGERRKPDGTTVSWRLTGLELAITSPPLPFFISWDSPSTHPGGDQEIGSVEKVELCVDAGRMNEHLGEHALPVEAKPGNPGIAAVQLRKGGQVVRVPSNEP